MKKSPHLSSVKKEYAEQFPTEGEPRHADIVIRRHGALAALRNQLTLRGKPRFADPNDHRVLYMSPLVDVAANRELLDETIEACKLILDLTHWQIRILSKSNMLPHLARRLDTYSHHQPKERIIYGVSTGTIDNKLAKAFEIGTALVSRRIEALHWLQDHGYRTFGMICPSLPYESVEQYLQFSETVCRAIRVDRCEHVWAEVMNVRGESFLRTEEALMNTGYPGPARLLKRAHEDKEYWEQYSRTTFLAHTKYVPAHKLRFLQYVTATTRSWWTAHVDHGAVLLT